MGDYDFTKAVFRDLGAEMNFWKLAIRPGQPLAFGKIQGKLAFGLPGNPVSSMVTFEQLVRPAMLKMGGCRSYGRPVVQACSRKSFPSGGPTALSSWRSHAGKTVCSRCERPGIRGPAF